MLQAGKGFFATLRMTGHAFQSSIFYHQSSIQGSCLSILDLLSSILDLLSSILDLLSSILDLYSYLSASTGFPLAALRPSHPTVSSAIAIALSPHITKIEGPNSIL